MLQVAGQVRELARCAYLVASSDAAMLEQKKAASECEAAKTTGDPGRKAV
ncbi:hypothetical protein [Xanthomonas euvesicatoria]|nr:hypothetical protein [Xanthomonas euvesicatoria]